MARNQSNPWKIVAVLFGTLTILIVGGVGVYLFMSGADKFSKLPELPIDSYLAGGTLWSDEEYKIEGRVENVILRSNDRTTLLVSLQPAGSDRRLPVVVKTDAKKKPIQREQDLVLKVILGPEKQLVCTDYSSR